ncbi:hypothetical protein ACLKA6_011514 [Drosophila palustris]
MTTESNLLALVCTYADCMTRRGNKWQQVAAGEDDIGRGTVTRSTGAATTWTKFATGAATVAAAAYLMPMGWQLATDKQENKNENGNGNGNENDTQVRD